MVKGFFFRLLGFFFFLLLFSGTIDEPEILPLIFSFVLPAARAIFVRIPSSPRDFFFPLSLEFCMNFEKSNVASFDPLSYVQDVSLSSYNTRIEWSFFFFFLNFA